MALINNLYLKRKTGKLANGVFYESKGQTIMRERVKPSNPKTYDQCIARARFGLGVLVYGAFKRWIKPFGATTKGEQSVYNMIIAANIKLANSYLPEKSEVDAKIFRNMWLYQLAVTAGTLGELKTETIAEVGNRCSILCGTISANTTLGQLTTAIIGQNSWIKDGDQLSYIYIDGNGNPNAYEYTLNSADSALVSTKFGGTLKTDAGMLCTSLTSNGGAFVISRKVAQGVECTTSISDGGASGSNLEDVAVSYGWNGNNEIINGGGEDERVTITVTPKN